MRTTEQPTTTIEDGPTGGAVSKHPAYGQISASRVSGQISLYGSDFIHTHHIQIRISRSEIKRSLSNDRFHPREELIEVSLSEAQWATFVSSLNVGSGPCCTINHIGGKSVPQLPDPESRIEQFSGEITEAAEECIQRVKRATAELEAMNLPKGKTAALRASFESVLSLLNSTLPFIADQFAEHTEVTSEKAKAEIHGYMQNVVQRAGLAAITGEQLPLLIEQAKGDGE